MNTHKTEIPCDSEFAAKAHVAVVKYKLPEWCYIWTSDMDYINLDSFYSIGYYPIVTIIIIYLGQFVGTVLAEKNRTQITLSERERFYRKMAQMEEEELDKELEDTKRLEILKHEQDEIRSVLEDGWSSDDIDDSSEDKIEQATKDLDLLDKKVVESKAVDYEISKSSIDVVIDKELTDKIKELEAENEQIKLQLEQSKEQLNLKPSDLDPNLIQFLERHKEELTLAFLEKAYETILEINASNPDKSFIDCIDELNRDYVTELNDLKISKKKVELKLKEMRRRYEEELSSFNEIRVEHILKNSGAKEYLQQLRETCKRKEEAIVDLKAEIEATKAQMAEWKSRFYEAEKQCNTYYQACRDYQAKRDELEAERRAKHERERLLLSQTMNMSAASSLIDNQVPPPPPVEVPINELLRTAQNQAPNSFNMSIGESIPPPPPVEIPFNQFLHQASPGSNPGSGYYGQ